ATDGQCTATVLRICRDEGSVFNSACLRNNVSATYHPARLLACKGDAALPAVDSCNSDILAGVICGTSASDTGTDPFAPICSISTQNSNFANLAAVQDLQCRTKATPADAAASGDDCYELARGADGMTGFCDGADAGDNPYATVCGDNTLAQQSFCTSYSGASTANMNLCSSSLATVCPGTPFRRDATIDCLSEGAYANQRADQCSKGTQVVGADCNTTTISDAVCITTGTYANPFADFCAEGMDARSDTTTMTIAEVRQAVYTACLANSAPDVCANTASDRTELATMTCIATNPTALFAAECDYMEFKAVEVDYCEMDSNAWFVTCNSENVADINSRINEARATICVENRAILTDGGTDVADRMSLFNGACNGLALKSGLTVADARIALAEMCRTDDMVAGCDQPADGLNGQTVAECSANPYDTTDTTVNCATNPAFNAERTARNNLCTSSTSGSDP
ncbi:MAG: hypothetical protein K8953_04885, partial [Proteobacteria bacterium]|nr:hypothetical protein [Pseudomonadota bacterium]